MKKPKLMYLLLLCCCLCLAGALLVALRQPSAPVYGAEEPVTKQELALQLAEAEQELQTGRKQLSSLLRAYYRGEAGEEETVRLIEQVENLRLQAEELRFQLGQLKNGD